MNPSGCRAQQVPSQQPQQLNQVPQVPNMYDPKSKHSMPPGFSMPPIRPQSIPYQYQVNQAPVAANVFDSLSSNSLLPELSSNAWTTPQLSYAYNQQLNEIQPPNDAMLPGSSMPSRIQPLNNDAQLNQTQMVPNMVAPRLSNPLLPEQPLMKSGGVEQFNQVPLSTPDVYNNLNNFTMNGPTPVLSR
nr:uncharacterized protein LOC112492077 [Ziziphus jujuba var. spinosa]